MTTLYIVRHGESVANHEDRLAGNRDMPLSDIGRKQAQCTAAFLQAVPLEAVYSSDLSRAMETAAILAAPHHLPVFPEPGLREICGGVWEGLTYPEIAARYPDEYQVWKENIGLSHCPGGESALQVQVRVRSAIERIVQRHPEGHLCLVTHGLALRVMEAVWAQLPPDKIAAIPFVSNASVTVVTYDGAVGTLLKRDLHAHLEGLITNIRY